jgi:glycosidase
MTSFADIALAHPVPASVRGGVELPRRQRYHPSPADWRDEVLYFLLVDRFSDGGEDGRPLLDRRDLPAARPNFPDGGAWRWDRWAASGGDRWQGGTLNGVRSKLGYLEHLGVTALWVSPVFKQRRHLDTYHGYGVQDFLDVDPRFGSRADLVELCAAAPEHGMRVILDIIFNHSGRSFLYPPGTPGGRERPTYTTGRYPFGEWTGTDGQPVSTVGGRDDGVWPSELQRPDAFTRAGRGDLGAGDLGDPNAEHKRADFEDLRDFDLAFDDVLGDLAACYKYWIALTDCDGFRIDTLKHVTTEQARNFCGAIREFAVNLGKLNFFLIGEIAGGDRAQDFYLDALERNLSAALDIGEMRLALERVAKGLAPSGEYFGRFDPGDVIMGSHRNLGDRHVSILGDHDHVFGEKARFSSDAASDHQVAAGVAVQLFTLGIPCVYYGTEQAFAGPEATERRWLPDWGRSDRYLREAMFGPEHPRRSGAAGLEAAPGGLDPELPGFGAFGTAGRHCFDASHPAYLRIAACAALRRRYPVLRHGRQYQRQLATDGSPDAGPFRFPEAGQLIAWSRILDDEEALCVVNGHGDTARSGAVVVDAGLNGAAGATLTVVLNTAQAAARGGAYAGSHRVDEVVPVRRAADGTAFMEIGGLPPSEVLVLVNRPQAEEGTIVP